VKRGSLALVLLWSTLVPVAALAAPAWGPTVGTEAPAVEATAQDGSFRTLRSLSGTRGLLLVFARSADW
jgi:hypothetical protein